MAHGNEIQGGKISFWILLIPIEALIGCVYVTGLSLLCFIAVVRFGDVINIVSLASVLATYLTPIFYPLSSISVRSQFILNLNPLTHFVNIFRKLSLDYGEAGWSDWLFISISALIAFIVAIFTFNKTWKRTVSLL